MNAMWNRREWLKTAGVATTALACGVTARADLRETARRKIHLAVFTGPYSGLPVAEAARRIKADGFTGVVCEYSFADARFNPLQPDWAVADKIAASFAQEKIKIVGLFGYYNLVNPDTAKRKEGEARIQCLLANWRRLGSPVVATETGTLNRGSEWLESPENDTESAYLECRESVGRLVRLARKHGAVVAIEPYWRNIIGSAERTQRLFRDVSSSSFKLIMDPCNYFRKEDLAHMEPMLKDIFKRVGKYTVLAHAKDVKSAASGTDLPAAGQGVLDYPLYLRLLAGLDRDLYLALEHLTTEEVHAARDYVLQQFEKI
jgi:sugar phosphate isomerase/epimerase